MADLAGVRVLVFRVADRLWGAEVAAGAVAGLINVRGELVPLVDGRRALGHTPSEDHGTIVLVEVGERAAGFTVDEVIDLLTVSGDDLSDRDELPGVDPRLVRAVGRRGDESFVFLDLDALLAPILST
jgi:chemotaxis signal transduction protein